MASDPLAGLSEKRLGSPLAICSDAIAARTVTARTSSASVMNYA